MFRWLIVLIFFQGSKLQTHANSWWWHGKKLCKILLWEFPQSGRFEVRVWICYMNWKKMNLVILVNFPCRVLLIPTRCYAKHYESRNKKAWCFSLWNILSHFMSFDYLRNGQMYVPSPQEWGKFLRRVEQRSLYCFCSFSHQFEIRWMIPSNPCCARP